MQHKVIGLQSMPEVLLEAATRESEIRYYRRFFGSCSPSEGSRQIGATVSVVSLFLD